MLLAQLVDVSGKIASTAKRLEKIDLLSRLLRQLHGDEIETAVAFLSGSTRQGRIGIGYATLHAVTPPAAAAAGLTIHDTDKLLDDLMKVKGRGAEQARRSILHQMLSRATEQEQQFLRRLLVGELRQGALEGVMLDAIAKAAGVPGDRIRRAAMAGGGASTIARIAIEEGEAGLGRFSIQLFRPLQPMLAGSAEDVADALDELGEAALEYKFDGARIQAHKSGEDVVVFSRRMNDVTAAVPEIVTQVRSLPAKEVILDGEVLSLDANGRPQPFQTTMRRFGRRLDVERMMAELPLSPFWFDLIYLDGGQTIDEPQAKRFEELSKLVPAHAITPHLITGDAARAEDFLHEALLKGHEGVMAKAQEAPYAAGSRGQSWLKVKQARTLDLVILAAEWGNGRRQGWLSNLHLGARDTEKGGFAMLGKTFKGLTDEMLTWQTQELLKLEIARDSYTVYVQPKLVAEIAFNEIQVSPRYASGLALRFARVKRYRPDKTAEQSDTFETVQKMAGMINQQHAPA